MDYWVKRQVKTQEAITNKSIKETNDQLRKYYRDSMIKIQGQFEETYNKVLLSIGEGKTPTPADLYKLDNYWTMQGQLKQELQKLGDKQAVLFNKKFVQEYSDIYKVIALKDDLTFGEVDMETAQHMINQIWCADGKSWSERVWLNTNKLQQALNDNLIHCLVAGQKTSELKKLLQKDFEVSYHRADSLVRTELAHIQTEAARQRYIDYGISEVEILVSPDERTCPICGELDGKHFPTFGKMPVPAHPNCRCCIIPVVEGKENDIDNLAAGAYNGFKSCFDDKVNFAKNRDVKKAIKNKDCNFVRIFTPTTLEEDEEVYYGIYSRLTKPLKGYYDVIAHGNSVSIKCFSKGINAETLSRILEAREDYKPGTPIRLLSCNTGKMVNGRCFAQDLANMLNVEVLAPDIILIVDSKGILRRGDKRHGLFYTEDFIRFTPDRL